MHSDGILNSVWKYVLNNYMYIHVLQSFDASGSSDVQVCTLIIQISAWSAYLILDFLGGSHIQEVCLFKGRVLIKFSPFLPQRHSNLE